MVPTRLVDTLASLTGDVDVAGVTRGSLLFRSANGLWEDLAPSTPGTVLTCTDFGGGNVEPRWATIPSGVTDHGDLTGLADDDHPQYLLAAGDTMTGPLDRVISSTTARGIRIDQPASYTANAFEIRNSAGALIALVDNNGQLAVLTNGLRVNRSDNADLESAGFYGTIAYLSTGGWRFNDNAGAVATIFSANIASATGGINFAFDSSASDRLKIRAGHATNWALQARAQNIALFNVDSPGGGTGVLGIGYAATNPTSDPTGGVIVYGESSRVALLTRFPSAAGAIGLSGTGILFDEVSSTAQRQAARIAATLPVTTDASRTGRLTLFAQDFNAEREGLRVEADGTNVLLGFFGGAAAAKPAPTGSRGGNAALASLLTALAGLGLITDSTTA